MSPGEGRCRKAFRHAGYGGPRGVGEVMVARRLLPEGGALGGPTPCHASCAREETCDVSYSGLGTWHASCAGDERCDVTVVTLARELHAFNPLWERQWLSYLLFIHNYKRIK